MKKIALAVVAAALPMGVMAQSAFNAYTLSQSDLRGTARFMSMAGAFGALGGDLSTLNHNPAGIGVYRSSEIGITLDIDMEKSDVDGQTDSKTHAYVPNFGYVGAINLNSDVMPYFQWGISYGRVASFDRVYHGSFDALGTSMSNYVANRAYGTAPDVLGQSTSYNPYSESYADWLSILSYNSYIINPVGGLSQYNGLFDEDRTTGDAQFAVRQRGYVDEYSINFGGNIMNTVYWGLGFGITDIDLKEETFYDEQLADARIASSEGSGSQTQYGNAYYNLQNYRRVSGSGFNVKIGAIVKPINEFRFGIAVHTPTYYSLNDQYNASIGYSYSSNIPDGTAYTNYADYDWKLRTPWKMIVSAAGVIGGRFILSADYEFAAYDNMRISDYDGNEYKDATQEIKDYFKPTHTMRLGAEYRVTPQFSVRAGFAATTSAVEQSVKDGDIEVYTTGCNPAYTYDETTRYFTLGLGYRYKGFYADLAYVNKYRKSSYSPFSTYDDLSYSDPSNSWVYNPAKEFTTTNNNIVLSVGYKF
ncbi:MAG: hypothetical protein HDS54_09835 [Barnesiella sp.]|nr:hypothetical protein [Barnesiella sp.]